MDNPFANPLIHKLEQRDTLSDKEKRVLSTAMSRVVELRADEDIVREHDRPRNANLLLEGWACRYKVLRDGRRQIMALHIAGDFVDLHSFPMKRMDHSVATLTPCKVALVPHESLREITERYPHLTRMLWLSSHIDSAILRQWLVGAGQRSALENTAHLLCELFLRLQVVGQTEGNTFRVPATQTELGDALGMSNVHTNRMLQDLREKGLITWKGNTVVIDNWDRLCELAEFDPTYLDLGFEPR